MNGTNKLNIISIIVIYGLILGNIAWASQPTIDFLNAHPPIHVRKNATSNYQSGYQPLQIKHAYGIDILNSTGHGQTIAIVDAYGSSTIQNDLTVFDKQFSLPAANLKIVYPQGKPGKKDAGWALETSLDVEWAHALAPDAQILLVVAKSSTLTDLLAAVDYATKSGAQVISMSWGSSEFTSEISYDAHFSKANTVYIASSGDNGSGVIWPAASPNVVAVGGTTLPLDSTGGLTGAETGWSGSGGGISAYEGEPSYQTNYNISTNGYRSVPDVSFDADPNTGVAVYDSTKYQNTSGWFVVGDTSFGAPAWAALTALADEGRATAVTDAHNAIYQLAAPSAYASNYRDIISGNNGGYNALLGFDFVTGLGSSLANNLVPRLNLIP